MLNLSGNAKQGQKRVCGCQDIWETLWFCAWQGEVTNAENCQISAVEYFWPLYSFMSVGLVWKHETGIECNQLLPRKLWNTVLIVTSSYAVSQTQCLSVFQVLLECSQFCMTAFKSSLDFTDQFNTYSQWVRPGWVHKPIKNVLNVVGSLNCIFCITNHMSQEMWLIIIIFWKFIFQKFKVGYGNACSTRYLKYQAIAVFLSQKLCQETNFKSLFSCPMYLIFFRRKWKWLCVWIRSACSTTQELIDQGPHSLFCTGPQCSLTESYLGSSKDWISMLSSL